MMDPTEATVVKLCDQLARANGFEVVSLSQHRASKVTLGLPDRRYVNRRIVFAFWFEAKAPKGQLTREQYVFLDRENACGSVAGCGGVEELRVLLAAAKDVGSDPMQIAEQQLETYRRRGFRGERKAAA